MEIAVEATMSQKWVNRNMMQAPPKSEKKSEDVGGDAVGGWMRFWRFGNAAHAKLGGRGRGVSDLQRTDFVVGHLTYCYGYEGWRRGRRARASPTQAAFIR